MAASKPGSLELAWEELAKGSERTSGSPPSLKTDDGHAVRLRSIKVGAAVVLPVAFTELELTFDDIPGQSATLSLDLPAEAAVSRFAVHDQGNWHDAQPLSLEQTQAAFAPVKPVLERRDDGPQNFSARVLAQPGRAPRLLIAYASRLTSPDTPYQIPLRGMARLDELDITVRVGDQKSPRMFRIARSSFTPDRDFALSADKLGPAGDFLALRAGKFGLARLLPETQTAGDMTFLVDTSASQPVPLAKVADFLRSMSEVMAKEPSPPLLTVVAFDQDAVTIVARGKVPLSREQLAPLAARGRLGGTDLAHAGSSLIKQGLPHRQLVWLSDFQNTLRALEEDNHGRDDDQMRTDSLVADAAAEKALKAKYADPWGYKPQEPGIIARLDDDPSRVARLLLQPTPVKTSLLVKGASWTSAPDNDEARIFGASFPEIGEALWAVAEYDDSTPLQVTQNGKAKPPVPPVDDAALATLLKRVVGGARLNGLVARLTGHGFDEPAQAARGLEELSQLSKDYGLLSPLTSFVVPAGPSGGKPRYLAGRAIDISSTRLVSSMTMADERRSAPPAEKCPELISLSRQQRDDEGCPPLYVDFAEGRVRLIADVSFAAATPLPQTSPHLDELVEVLTLRPELAKLTVSAPSKAQAEGVARYLAQHGIATERLETERLLEGTIPPRSPTKKCKTASVRVLLDVRKMSLAHINQAVVRRAVSTEKEPGPSRLGKIDALIRSGWSSNTEEARLEARRLSESWVVDEPKNPLAYVALGMSLRDRDESARAYGSLFELTAPGAGLDLAAALRFQQQGLGSRWWKLAMRTFRQRWQDGVTQQEQRGEVEGSRAHSYAALLASQMHRTGDEPLHATDSGLIFEAAAHSALVAQIEAPVFAHVRLQTDPRSRHYLEAALPQKCWFPMKGSVIGAMLSWEDPDADIEISVTASKAGFTYDSVLSERAPGVTLKWLPLPDKSDEYPITVSVRAKRLGKNGYAFGMVRELDYTGRGRVSLEQKPFVVTLVGESVPVYQQVILQRPQ